MKKKMCVICRMIKWNVLFLAVLIIGGVSTSFALEDRFLYEITAVNNTSKITTVFQIFAPNEREAGENVAANGWTILNIRQVTFRVVNAVSVQVGEDVSAVAPPSAAPSDTGGGRTMSDDELINSILGMPSSEPMPVLNIPSAPLRGDTDHLVLLPDLNRMILLHTLFFDFSSAEPKLDEADRQKLSGFAKDGRFFVFGHADNVSVSENAEFRDNFELSFLRAAAVKTLLESYGINPANVNAIGLGALYPAVPNNVGAPGTLLNRRVEIYGLR